MRVRPLAVGSLAAVGSVAPAAGSARAENETGLDLYYFSQADHGGQAYRAEGMSYGGLRYSLRYAIDPELTFTFNVAGSFIDNDDPVTLPDPLGASVTTQASARIIALDAQTLFRYAPRHAAWSLVTGPYYHHQRRFVSLGADLQGDYAMAGGDTTLSLGYSLRVAWVKERGWDNTWHPWDRLYSHNFELSLAQNLSPSVMVSLGAQLSVQRGPMTDQFTYVVLYDGAGVPASLGFESLPRERDRVQVNARGRWSPRLGLSLGLDLSAYTDTWDIKHAAAEPSLELPLGDDVRLRLWYRFAGQTAARYFDAHPEAAARFQTEDSDLGSFFLHGPGALVTFPWGGEELRWVGRVTAFAFFRSDGIQAAGMDFGIGAEW
ncbi:MAG: DUF3570 domain-containing protein [Myxococcota bacterium]